MSKLILFISNYTLNLIAQHAHSPTDQAALCREVSDRLRSEAARIDLAQKVDLVA